MNRKDFEVKLEALDYHKCEEYIASVLGYDLKDTLGKYGPDGIKKVEYRDFWHFVINAVDGVHNGCMILLPMISEENEPWQNEILKAFKDAFGEDQVYWVKW